MLADPLTMPCGFFRFGQSMPPARVPPANLTVLCQQPAQLPANADMGTLMAADVDLAGQYHECAARHRGLVEWAGGVR